MSRPNQSRRLPTIALPGDAPGSVSSSAQSQAKKGSATARSKVLPLWRDLTGRTFPFVDLFGFLDQQFDPIGKEQFVGRLDLEDSRVGHLAQADEAVQVPHPALEREQAVTQFA